MIIILTRLHKTAARFRPGGGVPYVIAVADPAQTLRGLVEIKMHGTLNLRYSFLYSTIHASMYAQETTSRSYKCKQSHGQKSEPIYTLRALTDITTSD